MTNRVLMSGTAHVGISLPRPSPFSRTGLANPRGWTPAHCPFAQLLYLYCQVLAKRCDWGQSTGPRGWPLASDTSVLGHIGQYFCVQTVLRLPLGHALLCRTLTGGAVSPPTPSQLRKPWKLMWTADCTPFSPPPSTSWPSPLVHPILLCFQLLPKAVDVTMAQSPSSSTFYQLHHLYQKLLPKYFNLP